MTFARRVAPLGNTSVGWSPVPSDRLSFGQVLHFGASVAVLLAALAGVPLDTPGTQLITCAAILLFGLPHGTFDVALMQHAHAGQRMFGVIAIYVGCAVIMYVLWRLSPVVALIMFFGLSIVHFAEDWMATLPPIFAYGIASGLLTAPALFHGDALTGLFTLMIGAQSSSTLAALALLVAPLSLIIASVGIVALWRDGRRNLAVATFVALFSMLLLSPVAGFALFFCLLHSPGQFAAAQQALGWQRPTIWAPVVIPLTCAALGIAVLILMTRASDLLSDAAIVTAFMTLSVLTLPHMVAPLLIANLYQRYGQRSV